EAGLRRSPSTGKSPSSGGRSIVYCSTRKHVESVAKHLSARGFSVGYYHAGRTQGAREKVQRAFGMGRVRILVATNAFGMGIDFPDVRLIVHYQTPGSLEAYYQEAGRAGRDGDPARCVMFFGAADLATQRRIAGGRGADEALRSMEAYAMSSECRQRILCGHFGVTEGVDPCSKCDVCEGQEGMHGDREGECTVEPTNPLSDVELRVIVEAVGELTRPVGKSGLAKALRGSRAASMRKCGLMELSQRGALRQRSEKDIVAAIDRCLEEGTLVRKGHRYPTVWLPGKAVRRGSTGSASPTEPPSPRRLRATRRKGRYSNTVRALENFRKQKARELAWKPYMVFQKRTIMALDSERPSSIGALDRIPGLGPAKIQRFGHDILRVLRENT
ncbi:MAG: HRDC domain-containing protein, partial [Myxococcales bacterium]|nr:HRDC domain-containing protein [Myxococcales bacterium]